MPPVYDTSTEAGRLALALDAITVRTDQRVALLSALEMDESRDRYLDHVLETYGAAAHYALVTASEGQPDVD